MAKKGKTKLPKKVAGVKLPKALRTGAIGTLLASPLGREIVADALIAAAGAAAAALVKKRPSADAAAATRDAVQDAAGLVAGIVTDAARHILPSAATGADDETSDHKRYEPLADRETGKKDKSRSRPSKH